MSRFKKFDTIKLERIESNESLRKNWKNQRNNPGAMHLRTLSTLNEISSDQSNTITFTIPIELLESMKGMPEKKK